MAADFDEPMFDDDFVRGATFTEPSARERARSPSRRERRRMRRAAKRARRAGGGVGFRRRRRYREPSHRRAVFQLIGAIVVLFAISFALWWWNSAPREPERPVQPIVPTAPGPEAPVPEGPAEPNSPAPAPTTGVPTSIPEI
ncbi:SCO2583/SCO2584 N-terminal domain-containing protein [Actinomadura sp. 3N407]|uniref:SCO2583/SCO2584 N-terminal domain-containing protein n=1 Tax=Actinomadura sp. 3N407 TaxID=3457423 RepID=UPI003FCD39AA